jgi:hypothetical protein
MMAVFGWRCHEYLAGRSRLPTAAAVYKSFQSGLFSLQGCGHSIALTSVAVPRAKMHKRREP